MKVYILVLGIFSLVACSSSPKATKINTPEKLRAVEIIYADCMKAIKSNEFMKQLEKIYWEEYCACTSARVADTITYPILNSMTHGKSNAFDENNPVNRYFNEVFSYCGSQLLPIWIKSGSNPTPR